MAAATLSRLCEDDRVDFWLEHSHLLVEVGVLDFPLTVLYTL